MEVKEWTPEDYYGFEDLNRIEYNILQMGLLLRDTFHYDYMIGNYNMLGSLGGDNYNLDYVYPDDRKDTTIEYYDTKWLMYSRNDGGYPSFRLNKLEIEPNAFYTWSFDVFTFGQDTEIICANHFNGHYNVKKYKISKERTRINHTFKSLGNATTEIFHIVDLTPNEAYCFRNFKLEKSEVPTEWIPKNLYEVDKKVLELNMGRNIESIEFADSLSRIENHMQYLKGKFVAPPYWEQPNLHWRANDIFSYMDANRLEKNISGLYNLLEGTLNNYNFCGNYNCGEGVRI